MSPEGKNLSQILLLFNDESLLDYFQTIIKAQFEDEIVTCANASEGLKILAKDPKSIHMVIVDYHLPDSDKVLANIFSREKALPCLICADEEGLEEAKRQYKSQTLLDYFPYYGNTELLWKKIAQMVGMSLRKNTEKKYCRVNLNFFYSTKEVFCDVYLRLNNDKYIKIFNRYETVDFMDLKKYDKRNIRYLYVRERDFGQITKKLVESLKPMQEQAGALELVQNDALNVVFSIQLQETVSETIQKIGLNNEAVEMTSIAINSTMSLLEKNREIYDVLQGSIKGENYASEHSFLLSFLSCAILKEAGLDNPESNLAMTLAAFFHDVTLEEDDMAKIQCKDEYAYKTLGFGEQEDYLAHPQKARDIVEQIEGVPREALTIIENHHERYDGHGFPKGLDYKRLSIFSSIFNLAHELVLYIYDSGGTPENMNSILKDLESKYTQGNYKVALDAASRVFRKSSPVCGGSNLKQVS